MHAGGRGIVGQAFEGHRNVYMVALHGRVTLRARLGDDIYTSWFNALEFDEFDGKTVKVSVPVKFLRNWIRVAE